MLVDSHCHIDTLDLTLFDNDVEKLFGSMRAAGVGHALCVCIDGEHRNHVVALAKNYAGIDASVGVHPNVFEGIDPSIEDLLTWADDKNVVAIGETGLDYFRTDESKQQAQQARFQRHIEAAKIAEKPLIIHTREARKDTLSIMKSCEAQVVGGVMHCFTETLAMAEAAMAMGFYISFSGIVTFKNAMALQAVAKAVPLDKMLIETDSPYLAPMPHRGKPNQPAFVRFVAEKIAALKGETLEKVAEVTTHNYFALFGGEPVKAPFAPLELRC